MEFSRSPVGIAGAGRVAQALGRLLHARGEPIAFVASRTVEHARAAALFIGSDVEAVAYSDLASRACRILIAVPDSAVEIVAASLNATWPGARPGIVLHTCGTLGVDALQSLASRGVSCGTLHPLQTISDPESGVAALDGVAFAISGDPTALEWAGEIARIANGRTLRISDERRPLYHAAAVMASNYVTALIAGAQTLLGAANVNPEDALQALAPLARTSLENALRLGPVAALTGPIERGDVTTVSAHLKALASIRGPLERLYRQAGLQTLELARQKGLCDDRAAATERLLEASLT